MAAKKKKFDPAQPVDIFNEWPRKKYPIGWKSKVYFFWPRTGEVLHGTVRWYHPARELDSSMVITPGCPFYRIRFRCGPKKTRSEKLMLAYHHEENIGAEFVAPMNKKGLARLVKVLINKSKNEMADEIQRHNQRMGEHKGWVEFLSGLKHPYRRS